MQLLASYPFLRLYLLQASNRCAIEAEWLGYTSSGWLRKALTEGIAQVEKHRAIAWIADDRLIGPISAEDLSWTASVMMPAIIATGLQRIAMVEAVTPTNRLLINDSIDASFPAAQVELRRFANLTDARRWALG
ncbi:hypothetical protein [Hymenobacter koreensis]|uniref:STAS/SEC14 domain-containing protein n=1 Tax=Hymenobacter koreensis TaxID=1084523 RepID=A0ABP8IZ08_9BACT